MKKGILKESTSPYNSPTWIINKKATSGPPRWRLITDFRALNEITEGTNYPIPNQTDIIDNVASARYITCLDLTSGYYQIKIHADSSKYTAFSGPYNHYEYTRLPMGLKTSPHTFAKAVHLALAGLQGSELYVYLDDIFIFSQNLLQHGERFRKLRKRLEYANLTLNPKKCQFLQHEANFLGHIAGNGKIRMDPKKIEVVKKYPIPTTLKKCKQSTSLCSYYRRFVKGFAKIARPLYQLQHKDVPFIWGPKEQESFETLRNLLCEEPILIAPDMNKPFLISCDASDYAVGAILEQEVDGKMHPCAYASRTMKGP